MGRKHRIASAIGVILFITILVAVYFLIFAKPKEKLSAEKVAEISMKLTLVSLKAESKIRYEEQPRSPEKLRHELELSNRQLFAYFDGLYLQFHIQNKHVISLVCDSNKKYMIAEDSACTPKVDKMDSTQALPCSFSLNLTEICTH